MKNKKSKKVEKQDSIFLLNPFYYLKVLKVKAPYIFIIMVCFSLMGFFLAKTLIHPTYKAAAKLIRYDKKISMPRDVPYKFQNFNYHTALQTIRTRKNLREVIKRLNLETTPEKIYSQFEVKRARRSDIIEILYTNSDIKLAVNGANILAEIFLKNFYEVQNAATREIYKYYIDRQKELKKELDVLFLKKEDFYKKHKLLSIKVQKEYKYEQLNEISLRIIETEVAMNEYKTSVREIEAKLQSLPKEVKLKYSVRSADLKSIENKEKELRKLKQKYTNYNPRVIRLKNEIKIMREEFIRNIGKRSVPDETTYGNNPIRVSLQIQQSKNYVAIISSSTKIEQLQAQKEAVKKEIKRFNDLEKKYKTIKNQIENTENLFNMIVNRLNEVKIALESSKEDFKFLEKAKPPRYPESNYKKAIFVLCTFFGLGIGVGYFILVTFLNMKIKEPFDMEERFGIELIGLFTNSYNKDEIKRGHIQFINNFLELFKDKKETQIVLFGSDFSSTGKSYSIEKLTYFLSHQERKVLYIESVDEIKDEIKDATINKAIFKNKGINLKKVNPINEYIHKSYLIYDREDEYVLPDFKSLEKLFMDLKNSSYDYVFFEMPETKNNPYFFADVAAFADMICLVLKTNYSHRERITSLMTQLKKQKVENIKGVLNVMDKKFL